MQKQAKCFVFVRGPTVESEDLHSKFESLILIKSEFKRIQRKLQSPSSEFPLNLLTWHGGQILVQILCIDGYVF